MPPLPRALLWTACLLAGAATSAVADVYVIPTSSILYQPTSYYYVPTSYAYVSPTVYATSYVTSSYYVAPTSYYVPTSYIVPTTYYTPTRYVVRTSYRRPLVSTAYYVPTTYYLPTTTTYELPVISTSASLTGCDSVPVDCESVSVAPARPLTTAPAQSSTPSAPANGGSQAEPSLDQRTIQSTPSHIDSSGEKSAEPKAAAPAPGVNTEEPIVPPPPDGATVSPPLPESPSSAAPTLERSSLRPVGFARSTLSGRIVSAVQGQPEKGVAVTLYPATDRFRPRTVTTDEKGQFQVLLTEGDWTVRIPKEDGKSFIDQNITVSGGLITDGKDQVVSVLTIHR